MTLHTTRRGRPATYSQGADYGTPELIYKRLHGMTMEPIDACSQQGLVNASAHWCALHLRWLYTLRYGSPSPTAMAAIAQHFGYNGDLEDTHWRVEREKEYHDAADILKENRRYQDVMSVAVYNEWPEYLCLRLFGGGERSSHPRYGHITNKINRLNEGLTLLSNIWKQQIRAL